MVPNDTQRESAKQFTTMVPDDTTGTTDVTEVNPSPARTRRIENRPQLLLGARDNAVRPPEWLGELYFLPPVPRQKPARQPSRARHRLEGFSPRYCSPNPGIHVCLLVSVDRLSSDVVAAVAAVAASSHGRRVMGGGSLFLEVRLALSGALRQRGDDEQQARRYECERRGLPPASICRGWCGGAGKQAGL
ncbi:hypothetical protein CONLIGDRAFT_638389 [Coniochaeta ligniaria NRRL 30616]|uniref:Uncharacterized protein n=1 Tax=Coniochaeta ligniaria NRRL 30616 TaxID=1408157 RepID=A0A1J7IXP5_9PEZI|nr:hypothetical protein CONLIGDRAFT_638389 [Coniochaeta ligniaria NRRL 30616]